MPETDMSISVNGQSQVPPGFRFHPTEEELLHYYLRKKFSYEKIDLDVIRDVDLNKLEPWDIQERCKIGTTPQNDWYFFSHKDKKYPTGTRTNRATTAGFWKATGRDKVIYSNGKRIGMRKTLVFYKGRAPHGQKSDWIMHEYRLDDANVCSNVMGEVTQGEEGWVVCRIFKKKSIHKMTSEATRSKLLNSCNEGALEKILHYMGRSCKEEEDNYNNNHTRNIFLNKIDTKAIGGSYQESFTKLPSLESPNNSTSSQNCYQPNKIDNSSVDPYSVYEPMDTNWAALDRLVASQLNGQSGFNDPTVTIYGTQAHDHHDLDELLRSSSSRSHYNSEIDLWSFTRSSSNTHV